jgi:hypothetical protein
MPALPGVTAFAHIHMRDLHLSPDRDATRVFRLCWHHHHGCYDQGYISILELLRAEEIWIENQQRPKPHPRDFAIMWRVAGSEVVRQCIWTERRVAWRAVVSPDCYGYSRRCRSNCWSDHQQPGFHEHDNRSHAVSQFDRGVLLEPHGQTYCSIILSESPMCRDDGDGDGQCTPVNKEKNKLKTKEVWNERYPDSGIPSFRLTEL